MRAAVLREAEINLPASHGPHGYAIAVDAEMRADRLYYHDPRRLTSPICIQASSRSSLGMGIRAQYRMAGHPPPSPSTPVPHSKTSSSVGLHGRAKGTPRDLVERAAPPAIHPLHNRDVKTWSPDVRGQPLVRGRLRTSHWRASCQRGFPRRRRASPAPPERRATEPESRLRYRLTRAYAQRRCAFPTSARSRQHAGTASATGPFVGVRRVWITR
jgi:hypothetical protein